MALRYIILVIGIDIDKEKLKKSNLQLEQSTNSADQFTEILLITDEKYRDQQFSTDKNAHSEYIHGVCWSICSVIGSWDASRQTTEFISVQQI